MTALRSHVAPPVVLEPIAEDMAPTLRNLFELYAYDFSEYVPLAMTDAGRFDVSVAETWWTRDDHFPFFLRVEDVAPPEPASRPHPERVALAGFALVRLGSRVTGERDVMDLAEFFVLRALRGRGIGRSAAHALFGAFPGPWEIRVRCANVPAREFWARVVEAWLGRPVRPAPFSLEGMDWNVFRVETPPG
jgi:predicted acetyltransferase